MIIWSIQPKAVLDIIQSGSAFRCDGRKSYFLKDSACRKTFAGPYVWMVEQMKKRGIQKDNRYPIWGWYKHIKADKNRKAPRIRSLVHDKGQFRLKLRIPDDMVLLSDFDDWHCVLCNIYVGDDRYCMRIMNAEDRGDFSYQNIKIKSWEKIFDVKKSTTIQACFPMIKPEYLLEAKEII